MAPSAVDNNASQQNGNGIADKSTSYRQPLKSSGSLDKYTTIDLTPIIGTEFPDANLVEWINSPNADELLRDLAIKSHIWTDPWGNPAPYHTVSERGVVFFRKQDNLTNDLQKQLIQRLGELTGKPATSSLHIHPVLNSERELGGNDPQISTISSVQHQKFYFKKAFDQSEKKQSSADWHSDIAFEPLPADYTSLRLTQLPRTGGDTLWASGYEIYDRISEPYQKFLETLTATFASPRFNEVAEKEGFKLWEKPRGSPENIGSDLSAVHPVVRTNPVTGWKSIYPVGGHVRHINGLTEGESKALLTWFMDLLYKNHDLQLRFKWGGENDIGIWDNRSVFHSATFDYHDQGDRFGYRAVGVGERPYFDPNSKSRKEALGLD